MMRSEVPQCYMCAKPKTSREHAPPRCFFPTKEEWPDGPDCRRNLVTVPSCDDHNSRKSKDDLYLLAMVLANCDSQAAQRQFSKVIRAMMKRPALHAFFGRRHAAVVNGQQSIVVTVNKPRLDTGMASVARALHYHHYGQKWTESVWINCPSLIPLTMKGTAVIDFSTPQRQDLITTLQAEPLLGNNQVVFAYQFYRDEDSGHAVAKMVFYEEFVVYADGFPH